MQPLTHDEQRRTKKAQKITAVIRHFLGADDLSGTIALDIGCSTGFTADALRGAGCKTIGIDIDLPGLNSATRRFGDASRFVCAEGSAIPLPSGSIDIVIFNHIYEHVVDTTPVMAEIRRVLRSDGLVYLGLGNKYGIMEPHHRLPFLSWLPPTLADRYVSATGRADAYYERLRTKRELVRMCAGLRLWDYTLTVLSEPERFCADDMISKRLARSPTLIWRALSPIMPTFIWIGTPGSRAPRGGRTVSRPSRLTP